jgi:hypothetical protein
MSIYNCRHNCGKGFNSIQSRHRHENGYCPVKKLENEKEKNDYFLIKEKYNKSEKKYNKLEGKYNSLIIINEKINVELNNLKILNATLAVRIENYDELKINYAELIKRNNENSSISISDMQKNYNDIITKTNSTVTTVVKDITKNTNSTHVVKLLTKHIKPVPVLENKHDEIIKTMKSQITNDNTIFDIVLLKYTRNIFPEWICDLIVSVYKGETLSERQIWITDVSRITCIIGKFIKNKNSTEWIVDAGGTIVIEEVITPIINNIKKMLVTYINETNQSIINKNHEDVDDLRYNLENSINLQNDLKKDKIIKNILKDLAKKLNIKSEIHNIESDKILQLEDKREDKTKDKIKLEDKTKDKIKLEDKTKDKIKLEDKTKDKKKMIKYASDSSSSSESDESSEQDSDSDSSSDSD